MSMIVIGEIVLTKYLTLLHHLKIDLRLNLILDLILEMTLDWILNWIAYSPATEKTELSEKNMTSRPCT